MENLRIVGKKEKTAGEMAEFIVLMKILNSRGLKWLHCGTPDGARNWWFANDLPKRHTNCRRLLRYDLIHDKSGSPTPSQSKTYKRDPWLIESDALEKSVYITFSWQANSNVTCRKEALRQVNNTDRSWATRKKPILVN